MELLGIPVALCVGGIALVAALGLGALILIKLGVIAQYALKEEPADQSDYSLDQSQDLGQD